MSAQDLSKTSPDHSWRAKVEERCQYLLSLPEGWDSYGGAPINDRYVQEALAFLEEVLPFDAVAPAVVPLADGGVQLEWYYNDLEVEICFGLEEENGLYIHDKAAGTEVEEEPAVETFYRHRLDQRLRRR